MAFNPFHQFRRYNKVIFAILAIICMFTFVLSSGMGRRRPVHADRQLAVRRPQRAPSSRWPARTMMRAKSIRFA